MSSTISNIEKSAKTATPSMKNLTDSVKGLGIMQDAVKKAEEAYNVEPLIETKRLVDETTSAYGSLKETVQRVGAGVGDDILQMKPTISNVQAAGKEVEKLKALMSELDQQKKGLGKELLGGSLKKANDEMAKLQNSTFQTQTEMKMLKSAIQGLNAVPFIVLSSLLADIIKGMKDFGSEFNERFGGMPARIAQATAAVTALVVVIGLATAKTTALGLSTTYLVSLWKSSVIYQGMAAIIPLLNTILGTTWKITAATMTYVAAATLGIGVLIALVATLVTWWFDNSAAIRESENRMEALNASVQKNIDRWKELNGVAKNALESLMTPAEKLVNKLKELNQAFRMPGEILAEKQALAVRQAEIKKQIDANPGFWATPKMTKQLKEEWANIEKRQKELSDLLQNTAHLTREQLAAMQENLRIEHLKNQYGSLFEKTLTAQEQYNTTIAQLNDDWQNRRATTAEYRTVFDNATKQLREQLGFAESPAALLAKQMDALQFALDKKIISDVEYAEAVQRAKEQWDPAMKTSIEAAKNLAREQERAAAEFKNMVDRFKGMGKTPIESFKELSVDLRRVQDALTPAEFASAKNKLLSDLASGLGIAQFLTDAATPAKQLAETYRNLDAYVREANLSMQELTAAKNRAREALEKQSEYYNLYQKAQDAMLTAQQKLNRELSRIAEEAAKWGWDKSIVAKMEELKIEELQQQALLDESKKHTGLLDNIDKGVNIKNRNPALEFGTVAYYEAQKKDTNKPLEKEVRQANKYLADINRSVKPSNSGNRQSFVLIG